MPHAVYDLNPVDRITIGSVGEPGHRAFFLQARKGRRLVSLILEKEQVTALALAIDRLLLHLAGGDPEAVDAPDASLEAKMDLEEPLAPAFRAGQVSLGVDQVTGRVVIVAEELAQEEQEGRPSIARFWATPAQMRALAIRGQEVVAAGRPRCAMCGEPIDPLGHFCPRRNGDRKTL